VNKDRVSQIIRSKIIQDEDKTTNKNEDARYRKVWRINERKEEQLNKEHVQEIVLLGIIGRDQSTGRKGNFRF